MNKLVQILRKALTAIGIQESNKLVWGYGHKKSEVDRQITEYYHASKLLRDQELVGYKCLSEKEKESIVSGIGRVTGVQCDESEYDYTKELRQNSDRWILQNPDCVSYDYYVDYIAAQCKKLSIDFKVVKNECEKVGIKLDIKKHTFCEAIELALDVQEHKCDIDIDLKVDIQKCIIDFETRVVPLKCDIDFKTFVHKISCGADVQVIIDGLNCEADINMNVNRQTPACDVTLHCLTPVDCSEFDTCICNGTDGVIGCPEWFAQTVEGGWQEINNPILFPAIKVAWCIGCDFVISKADWDLIEPVITGVYPDEVATYTYTASCRSRCATACETVYGTCYSHCVDTYTVCAESCGDDESCLEGCTSAAGSCVSVCTAESEYCVEQCSTLPNTEYTATLEMLYSTEGVGTACGDGEVTYYIIPATFTDSLGNTGTCDIYKYDVAC